MLQILMFCYVAVSIIHVELNVKLVVPVINKKLGNSQKAINHLCANVSISIGCVQLLLTVTFLTLNFYILACNCFEHSNECLYDVEVDQQHLSLDIHGNYEGGGVCKNCRHNTEGINCNKCQPKFFRPGNKYWNETDVCQRKQ